MRRLGACVLAVAASAVPVSAGPTRSTTASPADVMRGEAEGVGITSRGRLFLAPKFGPLGPGGTAGGAAHVWAMVMDPAGNLFLGTGPDGRILKVTSAGASSVFFTADEPMITALAFLPGGDLLAGTTPEGRIYRIGPDGKGTVWADLEARYVWSLAVSKDGAVFAGTGEQGIVYRIDRSGTAKPFFDSDEAHIVSLLALPDGALLAGGAGRGLVYRIDPEGHAFVLHDDELPEARALVREADGSVIAAFVAAPEPERRPPAVRIQVAGAGGQVAGESAAADLEDRPGPMLQGTIEGLPESTEEGPKRTRGRVVRIGPDGAATELWRSSSEAPFALALDPSGRPMFGTGEPARVYRVEPGGEVSLLESLREGQVTALARGERSVAIATSNPASAYRLDRDATETGVFLARPLDAGGVADWGTIRWRIGGKAGRAEVYTRTGNSSEPDGTWSAWSPALVDASGSRVPNLPGRFLQWRARLFGGGDLTLDSATVTYVTENRAPSVRDLRVDGGATAVTGKVAFKWNSWDPDGDPLTVEVQYRPSAGGPWATAARVDAPAPKAFEISSDGDPAWKEGKAGWDTTGVAEGTYEIRAAASDQGANPPGEGRDAFTDLATTLTVDRTPPVIEAKRAADGGVDVVVTDSASAVARLEVVKDGRTMFSPRPVDRVCDSARESFHLAAADPSLAAGATLRAVDAAGNAAEAPLP